MEEQKLCVWGCGGGEREGRKGAVGERKQESGREGEKEKRGRSIQKQAKEQGDEE